MGGGIRIRNKPDQDSAFKSWFRAQYGEYLPSYRESAQALVNNLRRQLASAEVLLADQISRESRHDAALKAWQAAKMPEAKLRQAIKGVKRRHR